MSNCKDKCNKNCDCNNKAFNTIEHEFRECIDCKFINRLSGKCNNQKGLRGYRLNKPAFGCDEYKLDN